MVKKIIDSITAHLALYYHEGQITSFLLSNCLGNVMCHSCIKRQKSKNIRSPLTELQFHKESLWNVYVLEKDCINVFIKDGKENTLSLSRQPCTEGTFCTNADSTNFKAVYKLTHFLRWAWKSYLHGVI